MLHWTPDQVFQLPVQRDHFGSLAASNPSRMNHCGLGDRKRHARRRASPRCRTEGGGSPLPVLHRTGRGRHDPHLMRRSLAHQGSRHAQRLESCHPFAAPQSRSPYFAISCFPKRLDVPISPANPLVWDFVDCPSSGYLSTATGPLVAE